MLPRLQFDIKSALPAPIHDLTLIRSKVRELRQQGRAKSASIPFGLAPQSLVFGQDPHAQECSWRRSLNAGPHFPCDHEDSRLPCPASPSRPFAALCGKLRAELGIGASILWKATAAWSCHKYLPSKGRHQSESGLVVVHFSVRFLL